MKLHDFARARAVTCGPGARISEVATEMARYNVGSVIVVDGATPVGIVTDRDIVVRATAKGLDHATPVAEIMTAGVTALDGELDLVDAAARMADCGCRRMPVIDGHGSLEGVVSLDDLLLVFTQHTDQLARAVASETTSPLPL